MKVPLGTSGNDGDEQGDCGDQHRDALIAALVSAFARACYTRSWVPWLRWVGAACVVVALLVVLHLVVGPAPLLPVLPAGAV